MPGAYDELVEALRENTEALREVAGAIERADGGGEVGEGVGGDGPGGSGRRGGRGGGVGLGDLASPLARAASLGSGLAAGDAAARAFAAGGDPLVAAQLSVARFAGGIPGLGALSGLAQFTDVGDSIRARLAPLRQLAEAGVEVSKESIRDISRIAAARAERGRQFDATAQPFIKEAGEQVLGETASSTGNAIVSGLTSLGEGIATKLDEVIQAIQNSFTGGGPR